MIAPPARGRVTVVVAAAEADVRVDLPVTGDDTVEQTLHKAVSMVAASYQTYVQQVTGAPVGNGAEP